MTARGIGGECLLLGSKAESSTAPGADAALMSASRSATP